MVIKTLNKQLFVLWILSIGVLSPMLALGATTPSLWEAATYGVLSSTYTNTTITTINGDVGFTTPPAVAPSGIHPYYGSTSPYATAGIDQGSALSNLNGQTCDFTFGVATDLSLLPQPLVPGVYCITAATSIGTSWITLSGAGTYIFRIDGTLNTAVNTEMTLTGGASACDVFWTPTSATTLAADSRFKGTVIDDAGITVWANTSWVWRALAFGETVTTDTTTITNTCIAAAPATFHVIKLVDNKGIGSAVASDFTIHVLLSGSDVLWSPASWDATLWTTYALYADTYFVTEDMSASYDTTFAGDCTITGSIVISPGDDKTCTITNTYVASNGWGAESSLVVDSCPDGDNSESIYDGRCTPTIVSASTTTSASPISSPSSSLTTTPVSSIVPKHVLVPLALWLPPIENPVINSIITLPLQLPNSWASPQKVSALVTVLVFMSILYLIELKKRFL